MLDFKKLMDPEHQARMRAEREAESLKREAKDKEMNALIDQCLDVYETLPARERDFVRSCRARLGTFLPLTEPQEKWLRSIADRS